MEEGLARFRDAPDKLAEFVQASMACNGDRNRILSLIARMQNPFAEKDEPVRCRYCGEEISDKDGCPDCGAGDNYINVGELPPAFSYKGTPSGISLANSTTKNNYIRLSYFCEHIDRFEGNTSNELPPELIDRIRTELRRRRIARAEIRDIHDVLHHFKLHKYYKHEPLLAHIIAGHPLPKLTAQQKDRLKEMFRAADAAFELCPPSVRGERESLIGYPYLLYKFCEHEGWTSFLDHIKLPQEDTLRVYDHIFEWICTQLGWTFRTTI
jgi:hypothetical protein